ncbi:hypothetical protein [Rhodoblastus sp.]|uniref:hypothetical protein n=1 Tax=Rhodoblastus sp. TaxID=1962975 RepID=UPI003F97E397
MTTKTCAELAGSACSAEYCGRIDAAVAVMSTAERRALAAKIRRKGEELFEHAAELHNFSDADTRK